jgi:hypothetical protein
VQEVHEGLDKYLGFEDEKFVQHILVGEGLFEDGTTYYKTKKETEVQH